MKNYLSNYILFIFAILVLSNCDTDDPTYVYEPYPIQIKGQILTEQDSLPVENAIVWIKHYGVFYFSITDNQGNYSINYSSLSRKIQFYYPDSSVAEENFNITMNVSKGGFTPLNASFIINDSLLDSKNTIHKILFLHKEDIDTIRPFVLHHIAGSKSSTFYFSEEIDTNDIKNKIVFSMEYYDSCDSRRVIHKSNKENKCFWNLYDNFHFSINYICSFCAREYMFTFFIDQNLTDLSGNRIIPFKK